MTPVDQTVVCSKRGNCMQAVVASLFDLELEQVPHFRLYDIDPDNKGASWFTVFTGFFYSMGYEYRGYSRLWKKRKLEKGHSVNGYFYGAVESRTFKGVKHAVVIDLDGVVVHDPNPNRAWRGVNVFKSGELDGWHCFTEKSVRNA